MTGNPFTVIVFWLISSTAISFVPGSTAIGRHPEGDDTVIGALPINRLWGVVGVSREDALD